MNLFDVYTLWNIEPVRAKGCRLWDKNGTEYLDFYGGHAVISIGHTHPEYTRMLKEQIDKIGFYSNSVINSLQQEVADKLGELCGYPDYALFLCNSGAEANENALKLASFHTGKKRIVAFKEAFHGRTSGAVAVTDNPAIQSPFNTGHEVAFVPLNDIDAVVKEVDKGDVAAIVIEGIQGVAGIFAPDTDFLQQLELVCQKHDVVLILASASITNSPRSAMAALIPVGSPTTAKSTVSFISGHIFRIPSGPEFSSSHESTSMRLNGSFVS
jgi:acetylornithine/N-succinyldiaminopimelate aminotransferase